METNVTIEGTEYTVEYSSSPGEKVPQVIDCRNLQSPPDDPEMDIEMVNGVSSEYLTSNFLDVVEKDVWEQII